MVTVRDDEVRFDLLVEHFGAFGSSEDCQSFEQIPRADAEAIVALTLATMGAGDTAVVRIARP